MFYSVGSYSSAPGRKGVSGLVSGMDTDEMVKGMTMGTQNKIAQQLANKQLATWKRDSYRETTKSINAFQNKYFTTSAGKNNILSSNFFDSTTIKTASKYVKVSGSSVSAKNIRIRDIKELATTASISTTHNLSKQEVTGGKVSSEWFASDVSGQKFSLKVDGKDMTFALSSTFQFSPEDSLTEEGRMSSIIKVFNSAIDSSPELKGKLEFAMTDGRFTVKALPDKDGNKPTITLGENTDNKESNLWKALKIDRLTPNSSGDLVAGATVDYGKLVKSDKVKLVDSLKGKTFSINFNGVSKKITFTDSESSQYDTPDEMADYLDRKIESAFGLNANGAKKIRATIDSTTGGLVLKTDNKYDIVSVSSIDAGLVGVAGALGLTEGASNRVLWNDSIKNISKTFGSNLGPVDSNGNYTLTVNNVDILINEKDNLSQMIKKIEDSKAGVKVAYSSTSDTLSIIAKDSGDLGKINITENDFSKALFGSATTNYTNNVSGTNASLEVSFDGGKTYQDISRTGNSFSLDGLNIELLSKADGTGLEDISFTVENNTDALVEKMKEFIKDYNELVKGMTDKMREVPNKKFKPITDEQRNELSDKQAEAWDTEAKKGILYNDQYVNKMLSDLRLGLSSGVDGVLGGLSSIGITTKEWKTFGEIQMDPSGEELFRKTIAEDPDRIAKMFTNTVGNYENDKDDLAKSGIAVKLQKTFNNFAGTFGGNGIFIDIAGKETDVNGQDTLSKQIKGYDNTLEKLKKTLKAQEERYFKQFAAMEKYLSNMNSQSSWLAQQFAPQQ